MFQIKHECERTVKYWLGLISSSHHATDSLVAVGVLSRMWYANLPTFSLEVDRKIV